jgi:hypothetical protein
VELYNACGDRHCPQCQGGRRVRWAESQQALLLPVAHFQVVFTLPEELRAIARQFPRVVYDTLFGAAAETLRKLAATHLQATPSILAVLHTWSRELNYHPHVHCVVSAGGLTEDDAWVSADLHRLFEHRALQRLFRGLFLVKLNRLGLPLDRVQRGALPQARRRAAMRDWVVWTEAPNERDPRHLVKYLARYVYQTAISDHRIVGMDASTVTFRTRGPSTVTLPGVEFARRYGLHVLPRGFRRVRHYGLLAAGARRRLALARDILEHVQPLPEKREAPPSPAAPLFDRCHCPVCGERMYVLPIDRDPAFDPTLARGPP